MKYAYAYKTSDGVRHEASIDASCREEVFSILRKQGIKAIKVVASDGSKANGELRGVRKRIVTLISVTVAVCVAVVMFLLMKEPSAPPLGNDEASPLPRQEIQGSRQRIEAAKLNFETKAEKFLARFVEPGRSVTAHESEWPTKADFEAVLNTPVKFSEDEFTEQIEVKRMVEWIKREMRAYLRFDGYVSGYIRELIKRQQAEVTEREKADRRLSGLVGTIDPTNPNKGAKAAYDYWLQANARLQSMGIYPLPLPQQISSCAAVESQER